MVKGLQGEIDREVWTCKMPESSIYNKIFTDNVEETFEYPCWGPVEWKVKSV